MNPVISNILIGIFFVFIFRSIYSLYSIFESPTCVSDDVCYKSFLNEKPDLDLYVYVSDSLKSGNYREVLRSKKFDYFSPFEKDISLEIPLTARNNGSIFIHSIIVPSKSNLKEIYFRNLINLRESSYVKAKLTKYAVPVSTTFNLLKENGASTKIAKPITHLRSRYGITLCTQNLNLPHSNIPMELIPLMRINHKHEFLPIVQSDLLNMRLKDLIEITPETRNLNFTFFYNPITFGKLRFMLQLNITLKQYLTLGFTEKDLDEVKGIFADTNVYLLCATIFIGSVHLLLDFFSFKNDVLFWKSQTSMAGLSTRSVLWRAFSQSIIFLFLLDEGTSLLVLVPSGFATIIEFWKVSKVFKTTISWKGVKFNQNKKESNAEKQTREYDEECMKYLSYVLYPLCIGAAVFSLLYQPHKSWYSWTINTLVNGVYAFGFVFMLPQLFINYRLKSVAALPWRVFTYRAFNTFIDDIFAFIITMPTAHRVACFRDDVVFLIYLYQRWLYPVDKSRTEDTNGQAVTAKDLKK